MVGNSNRNDTTDAVSYNNRDIARPSRLPSRGE